MKATTHTQPPSSPTPQPARIGASVKLALRLLACVPPLFLSACVASGGTGGGGGGANVNSPEFQAAANQIVSQISNSDTTLEFVSASNSGGLGVSKTGSARMQFTKVGIRGGVLSLTCTNQTNARSAFPTFVYTESKTVTETYRIPLAKIDKMMITDVELDAVAGSGVKLLQHGGGTTASMRTKDRCQVGVATTGDLITRTFTYASSDSQGHSSSDTEKGKTFGATVAAFDTREQARAFAREFQSMVAKLTGGEAPSIAEH